MKSPLPVYNHTGSIKTASAWQSAVASLSVFNKVPLIAWCSVSAWRKPIETPEETVTRQLKQAVVALFSSDRRKWKVRRRGQILNCQGKIIEMKEFLVPLLYKSIYLPIYLSTYLSAVSILFSFCKDCTRTRRQNQSWGKTGQHQSGGCYSRLSSLLVLCKTKLCVCVINTTEDTEEIEAPKYLPV